MKKMHFDEEFCDSCGKQIRYDDGTFNSDCCPSITLELTRHGFTSQTVTADLCFKCGNKIATDLKLPSLGSRGKRVRA